MKTQTHCCVYLGEGLASYGFGNDHPFGPMRHEVFKQAFFEQHLNQFVDVLEPVSTDQSTLELFHTHDYIRQVEQQSKLGTGFLDQGDTPAFIGMYEAASMVVAQCAMRLIV